MIRPDHHRGPSLLEKWLEDAPSANQGRVKKERRSVNDLFAPSSSFGFNEPSFLGTTLNNPFPSTSSSSNAQAKPAPAKVVEAAKDDSSEIDTSSINGLFGWETVSDVVLPVIFRDKERLVPVRIVEAKIIGKYSNALPWPVFSCINIRSYFVTEAEATLLNEINSVHCEYFFGYDQFTIKDVVVCVPDVFTLQKFLSTSKHIFQLGLAKSQINSLGFVSISGSLVVPYVSRQTDGTQQRYVPQSLIPGVSLSNVEKVEMDEWDASYLRMLLIYAGLEHLQVQPNDALCSINDLKYDLNGCKLHIEECSPPVSKPNQTPSNKIANPIVNSLGASTSSKASAVGLDYRHSSSSTAVSHKPRPSQSELGDANWLLAGRNSSCTSPNPALRSLHQVTSVEISGYTLNAINLKPYSTQQAVFISDVVTKMFRGVSILTAHYIFEKILQVKLYECTRLQEDAFIRSGLRPLQGDKLVLVEVLRKCISQFRHIIMAGLGGMSTSVPTYVHS